MNPAVALRRGVVRRSWCVLALVAAALPGCSTTVEDPMGTLRRSDSLPISQQRALTQLEEDSSPESIALLRRIVIQPGYTTPVRERAFQQLLAKDPKALRDALALALPRMDALEWRTRLCELIAENGMTDMTPTLINALAVNMAGWIRDDEQRPEYIALQKLHGASSVPDVLYQAMLDSNPITQANLRARCWELLWKSGDRERLIALVQDERIKPGDTFLMDLRASARDLGILPRNREEILWLRTLREPKHAGFWRESMAATGQMSESVRKELELRELPVAVAAMRIDPSLLRATPQELYPRLESRIKSEGRQTASPNFRGYSGEFTESLYQIKDDLKWGDFAAMLLATDMMAHEPAVRHIFEIADRDLMDRSTEYGGIIEVDAQGRFAVVEFRPRVTGSDMRFEAPPEMFERGYTALFHFHNHAQSYDNARYAGPHMGDFAYAESSRANCLVFTFLDRRTMNVDFYRHGRVVVDLGNMTRPGSSTSGG
ncbi:MAG: hypothetical protein KF724_10375 [Phycisphaeraceae bacterium]|nr:hypothetical protein [Phycisphaeraceae bacterium]